MCEATGRRSDGGTLYARRGFAAPSQRRSSVAGTSNLLPFTVANGLATRAEAPAEGPARYPNPPHGRLTVCHATASLAGEVAAIPDLTGRVVRPASLPAS